MSSTRVSVSVHPDPETFQMIEFPDSEAGPFVSLRLGDVSLLISEPAVLTALAELVARSEVWLAAAVTGDLGEPGRAIVPEPDRAASEPKPVGDTKPAPDPLPVGLS